LGEGLKIDEEKAKRKRQEEKIKKKQQNQEHFEQLKSKMEASANQSIS
jgi:hypothetical protein